MQEISGVLRALAEKTRTKNFEKNLKKSLTKTRLRDIINKSPDESSFNRTDRKAAPRTLKIKQHNQLMTRNYFEVFEKSTQSKFSEDNTTNVKKNAMRFKSFKTLKMIFMQETAKDTNF